MAYPIVRTDLMSGTTDPSQLRSLKFYAAGAPAAINNGSVVRITALDTDGAIIPEREVWKGDAPVAATPLTDIVLIATPELMADSKKRNLDDFTNEAGAVVRGYRFHSGDIFSVTSDGFTATSPAVGNVVELQADTKLKIVATSTSGSTKVGTLTQIEQVGTKTYYVVRVV